MEADCANPQICSRCGDTKGAAKGHSWKETGENTPKTCRRCGAVEEIPTENVETVETAPEWKQIYLEVCACADENLAEFSPEYNYDEAEDILYVSISAPDGTAVKIVQDSGSVSEYWTELAERFCHLGGKLNCMFSDAGYKTDCCIMLLSDLDEGRVLLASFNEFIRYDCMKSE